jgi:hypothetical protein
VGCLPAPLGTKQRKHAKRRHGRPGVGVRDYTERIVVLAAANSFGGRLSRLLGQKTNDIMQDQRWRSSMTEPSEAAKLDDLPHEVVQGGTSFDKPLPIALSLASMPFQRPALANP